VLIATKVGLEWRDGKIFRNSSRERIKFEIEESLRRLRTDHIDIYQIHWPGPLTPIEETAEAMLSLYNERGRKENPRITTSSITELPVSTNFGIGYFVHQDLSWSQGRDIVAASAGNAEFVIRTRAANP
jgi:Aldo/keto reductase family